MHAQDVRPVAEHEQSSRKLLDPAAVNGACHCQAEVTIKHCFEAGTFTTTLEKLDSVFAFRGVILVAILPDALSDAGFELGQYTPR